MALPPCSPRDKALALTGSALQVGTIIAARIVPQFIFGLLAGAVADRYNKRLVLMASQWVTLLMLP